jgi:hypothetical protein
MVTNRNDRDSLCDSGSYTYHPAADDENLFFVNEIERLNDSLEDTEYVERELGSLTSGYSDTISNRHGRHRSRNNSSSTKMYQVVAQTKSTREKSATVHMLVNENEQQMNQEVDDKKQDELLELRFKQQKERAAAKLDDEQKHLILTQLSMLAEQQAQLAARNSANQSKVVRCF